MEFEVGAFRSVLRPADGRPRPGTRRGAAAVRAGHGPVALGLQPSDDQVNGEMLDERKTAILRAVVQEYIETAQPVGSTHIANAPGVQVSSATVRNEMAVLEQEGYLAQPHTSAGRIPTDKGYRFFVDHLTEPGRLDSTRRAQVGDFFAQTHGALERMLHDTSRLLSELTNYAAVVVGPTPEAAVVRSVQIVGLSSRVAMVVVVLSNGSVENETLEFTDELDVESLAAAASAPAAPHGRPVLGQVDSIPDTGDAELDALLTSGEGRHPAHHG